jgi:hypothetical protein
MAPFADGCATCATPPPIPPATPPPIPRDVFASSSSSPATPVKSDISWLAFTLIGLPFLLIAGVRTYAMYAGDDPKSQGAIVGGVAIAAGIAWLISRIFHTRFRLTWAITYAVVVVLSVLGSLSAGGVGVAPNAGATAAPSVATSKPPMPDEMPAMKAPWPAGWTVNPTRPLRGTDGVTGTATLVENGQNTAVILLILGHDGMHRSLADSTRVMIDSQKDAAAEQGAKVSFTDPVPATWVGRPALQFDATFTAPGPVRHQRNVVTQGADYFGCAMSYTALEGTFEKHIAEFETMRNQLDCP